ncbi:MAG: hypothetical protein SVS85_00560, partial [Candidatus Nanohaloarchaea archaeon]|nr:hypothetical protein [Candidatus Nanohaloarchaea archaeon]
MLSDRYSRILRERTAESDASGGAMVLSSRLRDAGAPAQDLYELVDRTRNIDTWIDMYTPVLADTELEEWIPALEDLRDDLLALSHLEVSYHSDAMENDHWAIDRIRNVEIPPQYSDTVDGNLT